MGEKIDLHRTVVGLAVIMLIAYVLQFVFVGFLGIGEGTYNLVVFVIASVYYVLS